MDQLDKDLAALLAEAGPVKGLGAVGRGLRDDAVNVVDRFIRRLKADPLLPSQGAAPVGDFEDHVASYVTDIAQALIAISDAEADVVGLLRDGLRIQDLIAELHGQQRARMRWSESMLVREFTMLREEIEKAVRRASPGPPEFSTAMRLISWLMGRAERITMRKWGESTRPA